MIARPVRTAAAALVLLAVATAPLYSKPGQLRVLAFAAVIGIAALGLELLVGSTGQLSLAHGAFLGLGCYTAINLGSRGLPWPLTLLASALVASTAATLVGLPALRIRGLQVAIATLAFEVFAVSYLFNASWVSSGQRFWQRPHYLESEGRFWLLSVAFVALTALGLRRVSGTRVGRAFVAVRDVEARAAAFGVSPGPTKLMAYALSGAVTGLAGGLYALQQGSVSGSQAFDLQSSLLLVAVVVVGGAGSSAGILLAAFALQALPTLLPGLVGGLLPKHVVSTLQDYLPVALAALLVVSVVVQPTGIGGVLRDAESALSRLLGVARPRPQTRPLPTEPAAVVAAVALREVPRALADRMPSPAILVAADLGVQYGGVAALAHLDLEVRRGEVVGLIGANGAGKSTFFNAVSGLAPTTGALTFQGRDLLAAGPNERSSRGLSRTFQDMGLVRAETVRDNVLLAQSWMARYPAVSGIFGLGGSVQTERALRGRADLALALLGLAHVRDERLGDLPYGTMRMVEIAAAVASGPELLLLDEATAGLTPDEAHALGDRFLALRDELGLTLVVIEHHVPLIARVCDWCYCLESGEVIAEGPPARVTAQPRVIESFLGRGSVARAAEVSA